MCEEQLQARKECRLGSELCVCICVCIRLFACRACALCVCKYLLWSRLAYTFIHCLYFVFSFQVYWLRSQSSSLLFISSHVCVLLCVTVCMSIRHIQYLGSSLTTAVTVTVIVTMTVIVTGIVTLTMIISQRS